MHKIVQIFFAGQFVSGQFLTKTTITGGNFAVGETLDSAFRLEIHVASEAETKPKHDVSRSHRVTVTYVYIVIAPRRRDTSETTSPT